MCEAFDPVDIGRSRSLDSATGDEGFAPEIGYDREPVSKNVIVVGGGLAGLATAIYLARGGRTVTIFERRRYLGGRAVTHLRHGYRFNLGPHAFYRGGPGWEVMRELGIPIRGGSPDGSGVALLDRSSFRFPGNLRGIVATGLLSPKAKLEAMWLMMRIRRIDPSPFASMTVREWLDGNVSDLKLRQLVQALFRLATYSDRPDVQRASSALAQLRLGMRKVVYLDEGWQKIVDAMHSAAVAAGVNFVTSSRVVAVHHDNRVRSIEIGGLEIESGRDTVSVVLPDLNEPEKGAPIPADTVVLAVDPESARELVPDLALPATEPVTITCLDLALSRLPVPQPRFALGIDQPYYFSVHSAWAQLTPKGGALIHIAKYGRGTEQELEALADRLQPGWREVLVHRRFLPSMTVSNALTKVAGNGSEPRAAVATRVGGLYVAGDWVGDRGILADAALSSAREAARAILASE